MARQKKTAVTISTDDLVTVAEAAKILDKHVVTIYRWIEGGKVVPIRIVNQNFLTRNQVKELKKQASQPQVISYVRYPRKHETEEAKGA